MAEVLDRPHYGKSVITCLARMDGGVVGVIANQPLHMAGIIDGASADKMTHFIQLCDAFHRSALETAEDETRKRAELENYYKQFGSPFSTAETFNFDDLIDPRDTRPLIIRALRTARAGNTAPLGPKIRHRIMP